MAAAMNAPPDFHSKLDAMSLAELELARTRTVAAYARWANAIDICDAVPLQGAFDWLQVIALIEKQIAAKKLVNRSNHNEH